MKKEQFTFEQFILKSSVEKLDFILHYFNNDALPESIGEIERKLEWDFKSLNDESITPFRIDKEINIIINQLIEDKFILQINRQEIKQIDRYEPAGTTYYISLKGKIFIESGGYSQKKINNQIEFDDIQARNKRMEKHDSRLVLWTKILAYGSIALFILELIKWICEHR